MLTDRHGQRYFPFHDPLGQSESTLADLSQFTGSGNGVSGLACKADSTSPTLHKSESDQAVTLPDRPIIVPKVNSLPDKAVEATMKPLGFKDGFYGSPSNVVFCRCGETREIRVRRNAIVCFGFDGRRVRRFSNFSTIGEGISYLVRHGFRFASELS